MAVDFFLDVKGRDVRIQMKTKRYTWSWSGRKILCFLHAAMFSFCFNIAASMATCTELQESFEQRCATWIRSEVVHLWKALPWKKSSNMLQGLIGLNVGCLFVFQPLPLTGRLRMVLASSFLASHFTGMGWFGTQKVVKVFWVARVDGPGVYVVGHPK